MTRARRLSVSLAALFALVVALTVSASASAATNGTYSFDLMAGQSIVAGQVDVVVSTGSVAVTYQADPGFCIAQTHVDVVNNTADFPQNKPGSPMIGQFPQGEAFSPCVTTTPTYTFTLDTSGPVYVAAHAVVWNGLTTTNVVSRAGSPVTAFNGTGVTGSAVAADEPFNYPNCTYYTPDDTFDSLWDNGIGSTAHNAFQAAGADWIWPTKDPVNPIQGEYAQFTETFSVGTGPIESASLRITADNAYSADLNGAFIGKSISAGPAFPTELRENVGAGPQNEAWGVASQGWQKADLINGLSLVPGTNTLVVTAADEYMQAGLDNYLNWGGTGYLTSISPDPTPGTGLPADGSTCFNPGYNPGAVIYALSFSQYTQGNTGWAGGTAPAGTTLMPFGGGSWATYFTIS